MLNKTLKKVMAGILTASMVLGTMVMPAMAADVDPTPTPEYLDGITETKDTPLTFVYEEGEEDTINLYVTGISDTYNRFDLTKDQAEDVTWDYSMGSYASQEDSEIIVTDMGAAEIDGKYYGYAQVDISSYTPYGCALIQAKLDGEEYTFNTIDFAIVVNPSDPTAEDITATGVTCKFVEEGNEDNPLLTYTDLSLPGSATYLYGWYPTPYELLLDVAAKHQDKISVRIGRDDETEEPDGTIDSITIDDKVYPNDDTPDGYWTYSVIKDGQTKPDPLSENAGAAVYMLESGDTVTWTFNPGPYQPGN